MKHGMNGKNSCITTNYFTVQWSRDKASVNMDLWKKSRTHYFTVWLSQPGSVNMDLW